VKKIVDNLKELINLTGVSGNEHEVREFILKEAKKYISAVKVDKMGNVVVHKTGKRPTILMLAHMDEVGMIASSVRDNKVYINTIGGIDPAILLGNRVYVEGKEKVRGIITMNEVFNNSFVPSKFKISDLFIYTGLNQKELKQKGIKTGSYITFTETANQVTLGKDDIITGKALDDRIGCYILLELLKNLITPNEVYFVFTVQEEIGH